MSRPYIPISHNPDSAQTSIPSRIPSPSLRYLKDLASSLGSIGSGSAGSAGSADAESAKDRDMDTQALLATRHPGYNTPDQPGSPRLPPLKGLGIGASGLGLEPGSTSASGSRSGSIPRNKEVSESTLGPETPAATPKRATLQTPSGRGGTIDSGTDPAGRPRRLSLSPHQTMSYTERAEDEAAGDVEENDKPQGQAGGVLGSRSQTMLFVGIGLSAYIYSLDGLTSWQFLQYATSSVQEHSLSGTLGTAQAIIIAVGKPLMAKLADVIGRAETFILVTILYVVGYSIIATAQDISQIALGEITYAFGYTGLQILQQIVVADMTNLRWRGLMTGLVSAPFVINNFVSAELVQRILPDWRWGYGMFAILIPIFLSPIIGSLLWAQHQVRRRKRNKLIRPHLQRNWSARVVDSAADMDVIGLLLIAASLSLFLLPLGLIRQTQRGLHNPSMLGMIALGLALFPLFILYEARYPAKPVVPVKWFKRAPVLGACAIGFLDFVSFYLQYTYLYPYVYVTRDWNYRELGYFTAVQSLTMTVFGIVGGALMWATHRFKYMLFLGLLIRLLGCLANLRARSPTGTPTELVLCQILQGIGGGFSAISIQVSAQASVAHADVATITAMVLLISEIGNSVGSAMSTGMWAYYMPLELERYVPNPQGDEGLIRELYGSMMEVVRYERGSEVRVGAELAYHAVMQRLVIAAAVVAFLPPFFCLYYTKDVHLGRAQKARETAKSVRASRRSGPVAEDDEDMSFVVNDDDVDLDDDDDDDTQAAEQHREMGKAGAEEEGLLSAMSSMRAQGRRSGEGQGEETVPSYADAIAGSSRTIAFEDNADDDEITRSRVIERNHGRDASGVAKATLPIAEIGMSMGVAVPSLMPVSPPGDYFGHIVPSLPSPSPSSTHPRPYRHPGDAGHSVWDNTPHFPSALRTTTGSSNNSNNDDNDYNDLPDGARDWDAPSPSASPGRYGHGGDDSTTTTGMGVHMGRGKGMSLGDAGGTGIWGSPTGDSPRRERNWARRVQGGAQA